jgi:hypothetical protein
MKISRTIKALINQRDFEVRRPTKYFFAAGRKSIRSSG